MITLRFDKLYGKDRVAQPCYASIPLAKGELFEAEKVALYKNGQKLLCQTRVLSRYQDDSIRYLFLHFLADIPANKGAVVECDLQGNLASTDATADGNEVVSVGCEKTEKGYRVITGTMNFEVESNGTKLFREVRANHACYAEEQFAGPTLRLAGEASPRRMSYGEWEVIEDGPVCVVLSNKGKLLCPDETSGSSDEGLLCELRLSAYAGKTSIDVEARLINATEEKAELASYEFTYLANAGVPGADSNQTAQIRTCVADSNYKTNFLVSEEGETVEKEIDANFLLNQGNEHYAEVFYGTFFADHTREAGGVCATVYQAHQNFPKALQAGREGIVVKLVPEGVEPIVVQSGMAIAQKFQLYFHWADEDLQEINHQTIMYQMPDRAILEPEVYEKSGLYPDIFVEKEKCNSDVECALMMAADNHARGYGMMNWGDTPDPHYTAQGRGNGKLVWSNNEYDFPHACMLQFIRTGVRRFFDYCIVTGIHQMNVDVCHYSKNELLLGGQWEHTDGHCFGDIVCSHEWVEGLLDCYHLSGDARFLETAIGIGENVLRLLDTPQYQQNGGLNARETGWALRTLTALYCETFDKKWTVKSDWIVEQFKEWADRFGGWLAPYTDNVAIRVPFMIAVAVGSLMRYYREFPREDIKELILKAVDDLLENCMMDNGYFFYKELPSLSRVGNNPLVLEALAIAYELTGEEKYLQAGMRTFQANIKSSMDSGSTAKRITEDTVLMGNASTKRFAQMFVPIATYYKAISESGLL